MGSKIMNFDFWSQIWSDFIFSDLSEIFTRMNFEVKKSTGHIRFARFCHFQGQNWDPMSNFGLFKVQFGPKVTTSDRIFYPNMAKSCKLILPVNFSTSKFILVKISDKSEIKIRTKFDFKSQNSWSLIPFLSLKMTKSCKSDITSEFLDLKNYPCELFSQI